MPELPSVTGSCLCGEVRFRVKLPSAFCVHCHCSICRRNHGAAFVTWFAVPKEAFSLEAGEEHLAQYASSPHSKRFFCRHCGSSLYTKSSSHRADQIDVVLANVHGGIDRAPQAHVFYDDHVEWVPIKDSLPRLGGPTGLEPVKAE